LDKLEPFLDQIDLLLVMTVNPGFGGQAFIPETLEKVSSARKIRDQQSVVICRRLLITGLLISDCFCAIGLSGPTASRQLRLDA
jgi:hypothetical protein